MNKKILSGILITILFMTLIIGCTPKDSPSTTSPPISSTEPKGDEIDKNFEYYGEYGRVLESVLGEGNVYIVAEGYYGYHMDDEPSMTAGVTISIEGEILSIEIIESKDQTEGFPDMITGSYLEEAYVGVRASPILETDVVAGATITSKAVMFAVQTASYYADNVYGYVSDTSLEDINQLNEVFPASYSVVKTDYLVDERTIGSVLFAAEGTASDETEVLALKVRSATRMDFGGTARTGWDSAVPNPFTMLIIINKDTNVVTAWKMITDGTNEPEYFSVPDERINAYMNVEITSQDIFDDFTEGLVFDLDVEKDSDADGNTIIAGTSILYTGATASGSFSSQHVRQCFRTAAYFYINY